MLYSRLIEEWRGEGRKDVEFINLDNSLSQLVFAIFESSLKRLQYFEVVDCYASKTKKAQTYAHRLSSSNDLGEKLVVLALL